VVVLTLAIGVGATTAVFSVVDAVLLRPLPFPDARRVVNVAWDGGGYLQSALSSVKFQYWREHARAFDATATWRSFPARLDEGEGVSVVRVLRVSHDFLRVLGFTPSLGRDFLAAEDVPGGPRVALVSQALWRTRVGGGSTGAVGGTLRLNDEPYAVIGVLPGSFAFPYEDEPLGVDGPVGVIVPLGLTVDPNDQAEDWPTIARLREGYTREEALADVASLTEPFRAAYPDHVYERDRGMTLATFNELYVGEAARALWILMGAVTSVLLIACANVANLFLARAERRRGEIALRAALGATRGRIARFVLTESVLVALAAAALGLPLATWGVGVLIALTPAELPRMAAVGIDGRVTLFTLAAALFTALVFGGAAAWPAARTRLSGALEETARGSSGRGRSRQGLLVAQSALSMVLLVGAGLLVLTLIGLRRVDAGFDPEGLVAVRLPFKPAGYETSLDLWELERRVEERVKGSPAVASIAGATNLPLERGVNVPMSIGGRSDDVGGTVEWRAVTPGYFGTLGITVAAGRRFEDGDTEGSPPVAIVNQAFARTYFPDESPIGQRIDVGRFRGGLTDPSLAGPGAEIVGVVADVREVSLRTEARRTMYVPQAQAPTRLSYLLGTMPVLIARGRPGGGSVERTLMDALRAVDPALPRPDVFPLDDVVARSLVRERFGATLLTVLATLALALTAFGIYGVLAYTVRRRRREIGIRRALGAGGPEVTRLVVVQGIAPVLVGLLLGMAASAGLSRVIAGYLWGVTPTDPTTLAAVAAILLGVALLASWIPAREAVRVDPVRTLQGG
jgi:predicted permease